MMKHISLVLLFLVSLLLDHPSLVAIVGLPPLSLQFVWSVDDSEATLSPPPTLYMSSRSLSIRSATEYRFWFNSFRASLDGESAVITAVVFVDTCANQHNFYYYYYDNFYQVLYISYKLVGVDALNIRKIIILYKCWYTRLTKNMRYVCIEFININI